METIVSIDEPPSAKRITYTTLLVLLFFTACNYKKEDTRDNTFMPKKPFVKVQKTHVAVCVAPQKKPISKKKKIYLTFDDGPNKGTRTVLDMMKEEQVPVTFFLVGLHAIGSNEQKELMDSLRALEGIELCNHSNTHAWKNKFDKFYEHPDSVLTDFDKAREILDLPCKIARTPGRNIWRIDSLIATDIKASKAAADTLQKHGYKLVGWDMEWHFEPKTMLLTKSATEILQQIDSIFTKNHVKQEDHLVILAHDQAYRNPSNIEELHKLVRNLKQHDKYELQLISNYPGISRN